MAKLIPATISARASSGERELFYRLRDDPRTEGWVVLHSLEVRRHLTKLEGEIDLIVIVPGSGILCIEVKACDVSREAGTWVYPYGTSAEGPFKQVSRAMHSLRKWLADSDASFAGLLYFSAVAFTEINFSERSPEWHPWQVINKSDLLHNSPATLIGAILEKAHVFVRQRSSRWYDEVRSRPGSAVVQRITEMLRRDFEYQESARTEIERLERAIHRFTDEQMDAADHLAENDRVIFKGPAGTGKTFLALEAARQAIRQGKRVGLFCFNKFLGEWLEEQAASLRQEAHAAAIPFYAGTFHRFLMQQCPTQEYVGVSPDFWKTTLPAAFCEHILTQVDSSPLFDMVVLDEAQDLITPEYLDALDLMLTGGLKNGRWVFFGDFERQAIYVPAGTVFGALTPGILKDRAGPHATFNLTTNCRNARRVAETLTVVSGLTPGYRKLLQEADTGTVDPVFYDSPTAQTRRLQSEIERLLQRFRPDEIIVLSSRTAGQSCAAQLFSRDNLPFELSEMNSGSRRSLSAVRYTSVHRFKGLEASAIILTDLDKLEDEQSKALLYVGMSRARVHLSVLMQSRLSPVYQTAVLANLRQILDTAS